VFNANEMIVEILEKAMTHKKNKDFNNAIAELNKAKEIIESRTQIDNYPDFQGTVNEKLISAKACKKDKEFLKAIEFLEDAKSIINNDKSENCFNSSEIIDLLEQSKIYKKNKKYLQSIELLEQAKLKIA
jgi:tetratricopeptide (TPR) repeat protein